MKIEIKDNCPLNGFTPCKKFECAWFAHFTGKDRNTGRDTDEWGCIVSFLPLFLMDIGANTHGTGAAVESFRNQMVQLNMGALNAGLRSSGPRLNSTPPTPTYLERDPHTPDLFIEEAKQ